MWRRVAKCDPPVVPNKRVVSLSPRRFKGHGEYNIVADVANTNVPSAKFPRHARGSFTPLPVTTIVILARNRRRRLDRTHAYVDRAPRETVDHYAVYAPPVRPFRSGSRSPAIAAARANEQPRTVRIFNSRLPPPPGQRYTAVNVPSNIRLDNGVCLRDVPPLPLGSFTTTSA